MMERAKERARFMNEPLKPAVTSDVSTEPVQPDTAELNETELKEVSGGAFDAYLNFGKH
jgi:bacteriocin-like protein